jgi:hypothetical protein
VTGIQTGSELTDFCLVVPPGGDAAAQAGEAVRSRFTFLSEEIRMSLTLTVAERVQTLVERGCGNLIAVMIALDPDAIHGAVTDRGELDERAEDRFEIALP